MELVLFFYSVITKEAFKVLSVDAFGRDFIKNDPVKFYLYAMLFLIPAI
tara:strand:+ start:33234 stop:33380 length:147 start_codon:yes stop_codon:yes gene_type:complete